MTGQNGWNLRLFRSPQVLKKLLIIFSDCSSVKKVTVMESEMNLVNNAVTSSFQSLPQAPKIFVDVLYLSVVGILCAMVAEFYSQ